MDPLSASLLVSMVFMSLLMLWSYASKTRRERLKRHMLEHVALTLAKEAPEEEQGTLRSRLSFSGFDSLLDLVPKPEHANISFMLYTHMHLGHNMPRSLAMHIDEPTHPLHISSKLSQKTQLTLTLEHDTWSGSCAALVSSAFPESASWFEYIDQCTTEPLVHLKLHKGWLSIGRCVLTEAWKQRQLHKKKTLELYTQQLLEQHAKLARTLVWTAKKNPEFWRDSFYRAPPFTPIRERALEILLKSYGGTKEAQEAWDTVLTHGNLYDLLYIINNFQANALRDIPKPRLVDFVNTILESERFNTKKLPEIMSSRFDYTVLLNNSMNWEARMALLRLWMNTVSSHKLDEVLVSLEKQTPLQHMLEVLTYVREQSYIGALHMLCAIAWRKQTSHKLRAACADTFKALSQRHSALMAQEQEVEHTLLHLLEQRDKDNKVMMTILEVLATVGSATSLKTLHELTSHTVLAIAGVPREAKRAQESIIKRLKEQPQSGGVTILDEDDERGALSVVQNAGGLEMSDGS